MNKHNGDVLNRYFTLIRSKLLRFFDQTNLDKYDRMSTNEKLTNILKWKNFTR